MDWEKTWEHKKNKHIKKTRFKCGSEKLNGNISNEEGISNENLQEKGGGRKQKDERRLETGDRKRLIRSPVSRLQYPLFYFAVRKFSSFPGELAPQAANTNEQDIKDL